MLSQFVFVLKIKINGVLDGFDDANNNKKAVPASCHALQEQNAPLADHLSMGPDYTSSRPRIWCGRPTAV